MATGGSFEKDEQFCKRVIRKIRRKFVEDLDPVTFVDTCLTEEYLTNIQARDIKETIWTSEKNRHILDIVSKKGVNGYNGFKMCLEISLQNHLVEYLNKIESEIEKMDQADEESGMNKEQGYHCFSCTFSCESLKLLEQHLKTTEHLDMVNEQIKFSEKNTEPNVDEESRNDEPKSSVSESDASGSNSELNSSVQNRPTEDEVEETIEDKLAQLILKS